MFLPQWSVRHIAFILTRVCTVRRRLFPLSLTLLIALSGFCVHATAQTTTVLTVSPASAAYGSVFKMTAVVSQGATHPTGGTVTFTDTFNSSQHILGTVQVQSARGTAGTAILQQTLGGIGTHSITAKFNQTKLFASSTSSAQSVAVTGLYPTVTSLSQTGGSVGNWSLLTTVTGVGSKSLSPTGNISVLDTSNGNYPLGTTSLGAGTIAQQFVAGSGSPITVGNSPQSVVAGDFNNDGFPDLAVLDVGDSRVSILLGNGLGGFTAAAARPRTGGNAVAIAAFDLDGDGNQDLIVANSSSSTVNILLGNGDGSFRTRTTSSLSGTPQALAIGDFNGDGIPDVAVTNGSNLVYILLGTGTGTFTVSTGSPFTVDNGVSSIAVGDFNRDGYLDFATANKTASSITVMQGDGTGNVFTSITGASLSLAGSAAPTSIIAADFDRDGKIDIAVAEFSLNQIGVLRGNGDGTFGLQAIYPSGTQPIALVTGDFNADGIPDIAVVNATGTGTSLLLGTGTGTFLSQIQTGVGTTPEALAAADFDGDGNSDLAVANTGDNNVSILLNQITDTASALLTGISIPGSGNHQLDATYAADAHFSASTSSQISLAASPIATTTSLNTSLTSTTYGQQVVLTATLSVSQVGTLSPSSTDIVTFLDNGTAFATAPVSSGVATLNTTGLGVGSHPITAVFSGDSNFLTSTSSAVTVVVAKATPVITWPSPAAITYGTLLSTTQLNATATVGGVNVPGTYTYTPAAGTVLPVGTRTLSVQFIPTSTTNYNSTTQTTTIQVNKATPVITWATPASINYGTPLNLVQLNAVASNTTIVPLTGYANVYGIYTDGTSFGTGGFDGGGNSYSSNSLGTSLTWNGVTYPVGPANGLSAISNLSAPFPLPAGYYSTISLIGAMVNNSATAYSISVNYTDGTSVASTLNMSDWVYPQNFSDESVLKCAVARDTSGGGQDTHSTCVFGYTIPVNSAKIVQSITLPASRNTVFLGVSVTAPPVAGGFTYTPPAGTVLTVGPHTLSTTFVPTDTADYANATAAVPIVVTRANPTLTWATPASISYGTPLSATQLNATATVNSGMVIPPVSSSYRVSAIVTDGDVFQASGFAGTSSAYSANLLGSSIVWNGTTFPLGTPNLPNGLSSSTIPLPQSNFNTLYLVGAGNGNQTNQTFTISYTDGTNVSTQLSLSSWTQSMGYAGESIAVTAAHQNQSNGSTSAVTTYVYGYQIPLNPAKVLSSITLPNNTNVVILSMALSTSATPAATVPGTIVYSPVSGTILPVGTNTLSATFTPTDITTYSNASASVQIVVTKQTGEAITLTSSALSSPFAATVTFTATLPSGATGTVAFFDGATSLGSSTLSGGVATYNTSSLTVGTHSITAVYSGDTNYATVTSAALSEVITKGTATVTIAGVPNPSAYVQSVTITITVTGVGGKIPTGTVTLTDNGTAFGSTLTLDVTGKTTYSVSTLTAGSHTIIATYSGDATYQ